MPQGLAALRFGLGVDEVGEAFGFGEVELAVLEGAAGELARLGGPQALDRRQGAENPLDHRPSAMNLQLGHVLAGKTCGSGEPYDEAVV